MKNADAPTTSIQFETHDENGRLVEVAQFKGLTKREHFFSSWNDLAAEAVQISDALLAALESDD